MILDLFMELINGLYKMIIEAIFNPFKEMMKFFLATPDNLQQFEYVSIILEKTRIIGIALLILIVGWQSFKVMFSFAGFECEDPIKIAVRAIIGCFFIIYSNDLIYIILYIFQNIVNLVWSAWGGGSVSDSPQMFIDGITAYIFGATGVLSLLQMFLILYLVYKFIKLAFKFAERLVLTTLLIMGAPLAFACNVARATEGFFQGWVKLFVGNLIIQIMQLIMFISIVMYMGTQASMTNLFSYVIIVAMIKVTEKMEEIMRDISMNVGIGRDMSSALRSITSAAQTGRTVVDVVKVFSK
ncbi:MAG: hypothetical protein FIA99_04330 [Ruminiclostridium sp.]|nr:hypothetical protein [Ruminiclostridium sp.]